MRIRRVYPQDEQQKQRGDKPTPLQAKKALGRRRAGRRHENHLGASAGGREEHWRKFRGSEHIAMHEVPSSLLTGLQVAICTASLARCAA